MAASGSLSDALALLQGIEFDDSRLYDLIRILIVNFYTLNAQINPIEAVSFAPSGFQLPIIPDVTNFVYSLASSSNLRLTWTRQASLANYTLRYNASASTTWATATPLLVTSSNVANIDGHGIPLIYGTYTFLIKAIDSSGNESVNAASVVVTIPTIAAPIISATVISNNVLLYWTPPSVSAFDIAFYRIYKDGNLIGTSQGTFEAIFESVGGTYAYSVVAVDIIGNVSSASTSLSLLVGAPPNFILLTTITSTFSGTKVNSKVELSRLIACVNVAQTWTAHFVANGWTTPAAQVAAGYPVYAEPALLTGSYVEIFDIGSITQNIGITMNWNSVAVAGTVSTSTSTLEYSTDAITWSAPIVGTSVFAASVRYVRWTMNFVGSNNKSLAYYYNLQMIANVQLEVDSGSVACLAADVGGTVVTFNKTYKSISSINVTAVATVEKTAIYDFAFPPNPTTFKILVYDAAGARVNATVTWLARGII